MNGSVKMGSAGEPASAPKPPSGLWSDAARRLRRDRAFVVAAATLGAMVLACLLVPWLSPQRYDRTDMALGATPPSWSHWMGTDYHGRDLLARVCFGGRISFAVGVIATLVSFGIGVTWGGVAGYLGGRADRGDDAHRRRALHAAAAGAGDPGAGLLRERQDRPLPRLPRRRCASSSPTRRIPSYLPVFQIVLVFAALGAISWLTMARIVRGQILALREQPFVEAARSIGAGHVTLVLRHLVPNALGPTLVYAALIVPEVMMTEAFLSFLGLGTQEPLSSLGQLAAIGAETMDLYPWLLVFPAGVLAIVLFCCNLLGEGLRDALDPRSKVLR